MASCITTSTFSRVLRSVEVEVDSIMLAADDAGPEVEGGSPSAVPWSSTVMENPSRGMYEAGADEVDNAADGMDASGELVAQGDAGLLAEVDVEAAPNPVARGQGSVAAEAVRGRRRKNLFGIFGSGSRHGCIVNDGLDVFTWLGP